MYLIYIDHCRSDTSVIQWTWNNNFFLYLGSEREYVRGGFGYKMQKMKGMGLIDILNGWDDGVLTV